jgi:MFS family permease
MAVCFFIIAAVPGMTTTVGPFLLVYGVSYFFTEFGPNVTTFVIPSEVYPVDMRATGHGISAGVGKLGAFIGVFLFPVLQSSLGLRGTLLLTAAVSILGFALTRVLPEPSRISLEDLARYPVEDGAPEPAIGAHTPDADAPQDAVDPGNAALRPPDQAAAL